MSDEENKAPEAPDQPPVADEAPSPTGSAADGAAEAPEVAAPEAPAAAPSSAETPAADAPAEKAASEAAAPEVDEAAEQAKAEAAAKAKAEAAAKAKAAKAAAEAAKPPWERDPQIPEWADADDALTRALREVHGDAVVSAQTIGEDLVLVLETQSIHDVARTLHDDHGYTLLLDICGADYQGREDLPRFEVIYHLMNLETATRIRLRVRMDEETSVPTVVPIWRGANWAERETFDMYGIRFADHPDMTRILMWEGFNGYPLRKDFPVEGIDTGTAIYPEYYQESAGPVTGTGTGWKPPEPEPEPEPEAAVVDASEAGTEARD